MDDLEVMRQRRLQELRAQQARAAAQDPAVQAQAANEAAAQEEAALERILQQVLEPEARERLQRVRMSRPDVAYALARQLAALGQQGRLARRLTDADLRTLLEQSASKDRDIKITRR